MRKQPSSYYKQLLSYGNILGYLIHKSIWLFDFTHSRISRLESIDFVFKQPVSDPETINLIRETNPYMTNQTLIVVEQSDIDHPG